MSYRKVQELAAKFANTISLMPSEHFSRQLRIIIGEMSGDLLTLKAREFDPQALKAFRKVYQDIISISHTINEFGPNLAEEKLIQYFMIHGAVISDLDRLAKQHISNTNVDVKETSMLSHPTINSLSKLKMLADSLRSYR